MLQTYSLDLFSLADVRNRRSSCCNQHTVWFVWPDQLFFFFFSQTEKTLNPNVFKLNVHPLVLHKTSFVTWVTPKAFLICNTCFFIFSSWWSNALSFYFKMWRIASVLLGNMNSSRVQSDSGRLWPAREVPLSQHLFISFNQDTQDASLETGRPMSGGEPCHTCTCLKSDISERFC